MAQEIKVKEETKVKIKNLLDELDSNMSDNIEKFTDTIDKINFLAGNPEIGNIVTQFISIRDDKGLVKSNISELKEILDKDMQEILDLDIDISNKIGVDKNE